MSKYISPVRVIFGGGKGGGADTEVEHKTKHTAPGAQLRSLHENFLFAPNFKVISCNIPEYMEVASYTQLVIKCFSSFERTSRQSV